MGRNRVRKNAQVTKAAAPGTPDWFMFPTQGGLFSSGSTVDRPYAQVSVLYAAVNAITRHLEATDIWVMKDSNAERAAQRKQDLCSLHGIESMRYRDAGVVTEQLNPMVSLMAKPNPIMDSRTFRKVVAMYYLIYGGCNIIKVGSKNGSWPVGLFPTPAQGWERLYRDQQQPFTFYGWRWGAVEFAAEDVITITNPDETIYSNPLSPIQPLRDALQGDVNSKVWYKALLKNNARPGFAVMFKDVMTDEDMRKTRETLEDRYGGPENAGKPAIFQRDAKIEAIPQLSPQQLQAVEARKIFIEDVCMAFGVPRTELGIVDNVPLATAKDLSRRFLENTVVPLMQTIQTSLNDQLVVPVFGNTVWYEYQVKQLKGLREDFLMLSRTMKSFQENGVPYNEIIDKLELPFGAQPWGDEAFISTNLQKVETLLASTATATTATPKDPKSPATTVPLEPGAPEGPRNGPEAPKETSLAGVLARSKALVEAVRPLDKVKLRSDMERFRKDCTRELRRSLAWYTEHGSFDGLSAVPKSVIIVAKSEKYAVDGVLLAQVTPSTPTGWSGKGATVFNTLRTNLVGKLAGEASVTSVTLDDALACVSLESLEELQEFKNAK